ncbi:RNA methyltransferase, TrmH family [Fodinibius salinus]|uniref:RNA methyltransferase, TrmH family n=1 Tax=Fodinibius salinus TaxID=860790 RepID=A0A5D3YJ81_9BACT|nr:RNA methyltransferase [Fodinibius salinus]TYP91697.1 RNA methyltransferase, TrmH family [Fodinibius salinus]
MKPTSVSNRQSTLLRKLNKKKYRHKEKLFLIEGDRAVQQVITNSAISVRALFFDENQQYWRDERWAEAAQQVDVSVMDEALFAEVSDTDNPQGVLAICEMPQETTITDLQSQKGIILALDALQDPGNLGTIIRTASWFGATGILSGKGTVDLFNPKVVRATAGATGSVPHLNGNLSALLKELQKEGWPVFMLDTGEGAESLSDIASVDKAIIVVGNEAHGIQADLQAVPLRRIRIAPPQKNVQVESLNAAIATSIALYELTATLK